MENKVDETQEDGEYLLPMTAQKTFGAKNISNAKLKRTKFFFNARYLWTDT
jgi:hypothetical protein